MRGSLAVLLVMLQFTSNQHTFGGLELASDGSTFYYIFLKLRCRIGEPNALDTARECTKNVV